MKIAFVNIKGGAGKTTNAGYLAATLAESGRTMLVDGDNQRSATKWSARVELPFSVVGRASPDIARWLPSVQAGYEHVVIDTPPGDLAIIKSAVMAADIVLVPVAPTDVELMQLPPTFDLLREVEPVHEFAVGVLACRVRRSTNSAKEYREVLTSDDYDYPLLATEIPLAEVYARATGMVPVVNDLWRGLVKELQEDE